MKRAFLLLSALSFGQAAEAQPLSPTASQPSFASAELRASKPGTTDGGSWFTQGGQFVSRGANLLNLISTAYGVEEDAINGGPSWLDSDRFDITTKVAAGTSQETSKLMLQSLLADRFKLAIQKQDKELPVFALTLGKRALKLKESEGDRPTDCDQTGGGRGVLFTLTCQHMTLKELAPILKRLGFLDRPVVNLTGLDKPYDFALSVTLPGQRRKPTDTDTDRPPDVSVFEAVDKLGLKLEPQKQTVSVLVVSNVSKLPKENAAGSTTAKTAEFEVADVRASKPGTPVRFNIQPTGRVEMTGVPMKVMLRMAFDFDQDDRIAGLPKWAETQAFDVVAKGAPFESNPDAFPQMMRAMLIERFKLVTHDDEQPVSIYALTVGKRGQKFKEADGSVRGSCKPSAANGKKVFTCQNTTMAQLAEKLRGQAPAYVDRAVVDLTGLKGSYDFSFAWTTKGQLATGGTNQSGAAPVAADPTGDVTLYEAIDRDLGLKLELQKYPMPVVVIDHLERTPTEN
jgi:uncharacterized protein (TIGR03435 family)